MARANIPGIGVVEFPDSMSDDEIKRQATLIRDRAIAESQPPQYDPKDLTNMAKFKGAAARSLGSIASGVTDVIPAMGASALGYEDYAEEQMKEREAKLAALEEAHPTAYRSYKEVEGVSDVPGYLSELAGSQVPNIGLMATGAGAGALGARALLGEAAVGTGATAGLGAGSGAINIPDTFSQIYEDTGSLEPGIAMTVGSLVSYLDTILPAGLGKQLGVAGKKVLATDMLAGSKLIPTTWKKEFIGGVLKDAGTEGLTEGAQSALQIIGSQMAGDPESPFSQRNVDRILNDTIAGTIMGGGVGVPTSAIEAGRTKQDVQNQIDLRKQQEQEFLDRGWAGGEGYDVPTQLRQKQAVEQAPVQEGEEGGEPPVGRERPSTVLDAESLKATGLKTNAGFYTNLVGRDLSNPAQRADVEATLEKVSKHRTLDPEIKKGIADLYERATNAVTPVETKQYKEQPDLFGEELAAAKEEGARPTAAEMDIGPPQGYAEPAGEQTDLFEPRRLNAPPTYVGPNGEVFSSDVEARAYKSYTDRLQAARDEQAFRAQYAPQEITATAPQPRGLLPAPATPVGPNGEVFSSYAEAEAYRDYQARLKTARDEQEFRAKYAPQEITTPTPQPRGLLPAPATPVGPNGEVFSSYAEADAYKSYQDRLRAARDEQEFRARYAPQPSEPSQPDLFPGEKYAAELQARRAAAAAEPTTETAEPRSIQRRGTVQQEMFGPRGGVTRGARGDLSGDATRGLGAGPAVPVQPEGQAPAGGAGVSGPVRVGPSEPSTTQPTTGTKAKRGPLEIDPTAVSQSARSLHPATADALKNGDLRTAIEHLTSHPNKLIAKTASRFLQALGDTKVSVGHVLRNESDTHIPGMFDPTTNTIHLDSHRGMNPHVLLHEVGHALMSAELDKPGSILTRQLQQLFDKVKGSLDTDYGAKDVHEFAAEAWSNPEFAHKLASMHPNGSPHSAWDRFKRAVSNFFRRLFGAEPKPLESVKDELDSLIDSIIRPAPFSRDAGALYGPHGPRNYINGVNKVIDSTPIFNDKIKSGISTAMDGLSNKGKSAVQAFLTLPALADVAEEHLPGMAKLMDTLVRERGAEENRLNQKLDATMRGVLDVAMKAAPKQIDALGVLVNDSTIYGVDPSIEEHVARTKYKQDPDKLRQYQSLRAQFNKLDPSWKRAYTVMRDGYKEMFEHLKNTIAERIEESGLSPTAKTKIMDEMINRLEDNGIIEPYFALAREGDHWLAADYIDENGQTQSTVEAFKSDYLRAHRKQDLYEKTLRGIQKRLGRAPTEEELDKVLRLNDYAKASEIDYRRAPSGSFVQDMIKVMQANNVDEQVMEETMRLFLAALPETAMAKSFQKRKGTPGASTDAVGTFLRKNRSMAHQITNMKYNPKLSAVYDRMVEHATAIGQGTDKEPARNNDVEMQYVNEFGKRMKHILNPTKQDLGDILTGAAFIQTLGWNLSSALVNTLSIPMSVAPYLNSIYTDSSVMRAIGDATKIFMGSGTSVDKEYLGGASGDKVKMKVMPSIDNLDPTSKEGRELAPLIEAARREGQLIRSQLYEMIHADPNGTGISKINATAGWFLHHGERMNREVTMVATYNLELAKLKKEGKLSLKDAQKAAADKAIYTTELINGAIAAAASPRVAHSSIGKMAFMYKKYNLSQYYLIFKAMRDMKVYGLSSEEGKAARKYIAGIYLSTALMAGVQGVPFFGAATLIANMFKDDDEDDAATSVRKFTKELAYKGLIEYFTNLAVAERIGLGDIIYRDAKGGGDPTSFSQQMGQIAFGPIAGTGDKLKRGYSKIQEGQLERGIEDLLPTAFGNMLKATRFAFDGNKTLRGDPITGDVSFWNVAGQYLGFAPSDVQRQLEQNSRLKGVEKSGNEKARKLRQKINTARTVHDAAGVREYKQELLNLGAKHPGLKINSATIDKSLEKSWKTYTGRNVRHGITLSKNMAAELEKSASEWGDTPWTDDEE